MTRNVALADEKSLVAVRRHESDARVRVVTIPRRGAETLVAALASWGKFEAGLTEAMLQTRYDTWRAAAWLSLLRSRTGIGWRENDDRPHRRRVCRPPGCRWWHDPSQPSETPGSEHSLTAVDPQGAVFGSVGPRL